MRHWFNWLLGEPLPKYKPPKQPKYYEVESSISGLPGTYSVVYYHTSLEKAKEKMDELIQEAKYNHYRIVKF